MHFNKRDDTLLDLVDALCSNTQARSVVELSLSPYFPRDYNSLFKAIDRYEPGWVHANLAQLAAPSWPRPRVRPFWLLGVDATTCARPYAPKLADRQCVYQSRPLKIQKPITLGHQYSEVGLLPEREGQAGPHWIIPLSTQRVSSGEDKEMVGSAQVRVLLEDTLLPLSRQLCVEVADSSYCKPAYLAANRDQKNLVSIIRVPSNRILYHQPEKDKPTAKAEGHPKLFGKRFYLGQDATRPIPDKRGTTTFTNQRQRVYRVEMEAWYNLLMRGKHKPNWIEMQNYPFTLLRIRCYNEQAELLEARPMWLLVMGEQRYQLSLEAIFRAYQQRYDLEHFFRYAKQRLLLDRYQTYKTPHEENWWKLVHLAYLQLWIAKPYARNIPRPWERYLPQAKEKLLSAGMVQRNFGEVLRQFGTPSRTPKRRGYSPGRARGTILPPRMYQPIIFKHSR